MGHIVNSDREYRLLQRRLDRNVTGAPDSAVFMKILKLLFSPGEADLARRMPTAFTPLGRLSRRLGIPPEELDGKLTAMAGKGLVVDFEVDGRRYFSLAPVVIGFFEFTFMRAPGDLPMKELAHLFEEYMMGDDRFIRSVMEGQTQIGRALVREESIPDVDFSEVLDWERATHVVESATAIGVARCQCRHKAEHVGKACQAPQEVCLSFNYAADYTVRHGFARAVTRQEAMKILEQSKDAGLAQIGDNVKRKLSYICNCCGCCCGMISSMKRFNIRNGVVTSNWMMEIDSSKCKGCGKCVHSCPLEAISLDSGVRGGNTAVCDAGLCLGCGVCYSACKFGAISMKNRPKRILTPETAFDRVVAMAVERGKLASLLFEDPEKISHRALGRVINILEKSPPFKALLAVEPLRSVFLNTVVQGAKLKQRPIRKLFE